MPQTANKGYETQATASNIGTWGDVLNNNMISFADVNMGGIVTKTLSNANVTLTATESRNAMIRLNGTLTADVFVVNATIGFYMVENVTSGAFNLLISNGSGGFTLPQNYRAVVYNDVGPSAFARCYALASITNPDPMPTGTQMFFFSAGAPTGWTLVTSNNDYALTLSSSTGGTTSGSIAYSTLYSRTTTDSHVVTNSESPAHAHNMVYSAAGPNGSPDGVVHWYERVASDLGPVTATTDTMGTGGGGHTHDMDMRVLTVTTIICSRSN